MLKLVVMTYVTRIVSRSELMWPCVMLTLRSTRPIERTIKTYELLL